MDASQAAQEDGSCAFAIVSSDPGCVPLLTTLRARGHLPLAVTTSPAPDASTAAAAASPEHSTAPTVPDGISQIHLTVAPADSDSPTQPTPAAGAQSGAPAVAVAAAGLEAGLSAGHGGLDHNLEVQRDQHRGITEATPGTWPPPDGLRTSHADALPPEEAVRVEDTPAPADARPSGRSAELEVKTETDGRDAFSHSIRPGYTDADADADLRRLLGSLPSRAEQCALLSGCLDRVSEEVFHCLRRRMLQAPQGFCDTEDFPHEIVVVPSLRFALVAGYAAESTWLPEEQAAVLEMLLRFDSRHLFAQLGLLAVMVRAGLTASCR